MKGRSTNTRDTRRGLQIEQSSEFDPHTYEIAHMASIRCGKPSGGRQIDLAHTESCEEIWGPDGHRRTPSISSESTHAVHT